MVDYTTSRSGSGGAIGLLVAAGAIVLFILYALFAGGGVSTTTDPAALDATIAPAADPGAAPAVDDTAAPVPATD